MNKLPNSAHIKNFSTFYDDLQNDNLSSFIWLQPSMTTSVKSQNKNKNKNKKRQNIKTTFFLQNLAKQEKTQKLKKCQKKILEKNSFSCQCLVVNAVLVSWFFLLLCK